MAFVNSDEFLSEHYESRVSAWYFRGILHPGAKTLRLFHFWENGFCINSVRVLPDQRARVTWVQSIQTNIPRRDRQKLGLWLDDLLPSPQKIGHCPSQPGDNQVSVLGSKSLFTLAKNPSNSSAQILCTLSFLFDFIWDALELYFRIIILFIFLGLIVQLNVPAACNNSRSCLIQASAL